MRSARDPSWSPTTRLISRTSQTSRWRIGRPLRVPLGPSRLGAIAARAGRTLWMIGPSAVLLAAILTYGCAVGFPGLAMSDERSHAVTWHHVFFHARAGLIVFLIAAVALIVPSQMKDLLADLADFNGGDLALAVAFHVALILMAFFLWYWTRTVQIGRAHV